MSGTMEILIREMTIEDYEAVYHLWTEIRGFGIRSIDDSKEGVERFLKRNPTTSVVAVQNGRIVGNILCGHDGRTGCFYHVCVDPDYRKHGIGYRMVRAAIHALQKEGVSKISLIAVSYTHLDVYKRQADRCGYVEQPGGRKALECPDGWKYVSGGSDPDRLSVCK